MRICGSNEGGVGSSDRSNGQDTRHAAAREASMLIISAWAREAGKNFATNWPGR